MKYSITQYNRRINILRWESDLWSLLNSYLISGPTLALITFIIYMRTVAPGVWVFDSAELASGVYSLGIIHPPGYPLYILLGKVFISLLPIENVAYKLNILSAIFASGTVLFLYETLIKITHNKFASWSASAFFSVTNYFWQMALVAEVYTLHTFFLSFNLYLIFSILRNFRYWKLLLFSFVFGLSICNHTSGILFAFGFIWLLFINRKFHLRNLILISPLIIIFILSLFPYLYLPIRGSSDPPLNYAREYSSVNLTTFRGVWWMISGQAYRYFAFGYPWSEIPNEITRFFIYLWRNFLGVGVILGIIGIYNLVRKNWKRAIGLILIFGFNVVFFVNYRVIDKDTMFLPAFLIWVFFLAEGLKLLLCLSRRVISNGEFLTNNRNLIGFSLLLLPVIPLIFNWKWVDMSSMHGTDSFARHVFENSYPNSLVIGEWSSSVILEYYQIVEGIRPDLRIYNRARSESAQFYENWIQGIPYQDNIKIILDRELDTICSEIVKRKVYMVEFDPNYEKHFEFITIGDFFELKKKSDICGND